jgi:predicted  nucleic acid-binding Zn-ribbon protein
MGESVEGLEPRLARVEANVVHLVAQNAEIKTELRATNDRIDKLRDRVDEQFSKVDEKFDKIDERFAAMLEKIGELKVWTIIVVGGGVLSIVARTFHWI